MRLIDSDKVIQSVDRQMIIARELLGNDTQVQEFVSIAEQSIKQEISNAPTVQAIPIEWIMWVWRRNQPDDTQEDVWMRLGVLKMLRDWEKENETV